MKRLLPLALCGLCLCAAPLQARDELFDAAKYYAGARDLLTDGVRPLEGRNPWANAPFLTLRHRDALFVARLWHRGLKGDDGHFSREETVVLLTRDGLHEVGTIRDNRAILRQSALIFFDWDFTLENATLLKKLSAGSVTSDLTVAQYQAIVEAVTPRFATTVRDAATPSVAPPHIEVVSRKNDANTFDDLIIPPPRFEGTGDKRVAVFESLRYNPYANTIYKERTEIAPGLFRQTTRDLIVGPEKVSQSDLEGRHLNLPNSSGHIYTREEFDSARAFESLIEMVLPQLKGRD